VPIANAPVTRSSTLPLGFLALFIATTVYAFAQLQWLPSDSGVTVAICVLAATVAAQVIASIFGFASGDATVGTGMAILAGTWAAVAISTLTAGSVAPNDPLGVVLLCAAVTLLIPAAVGSGPPIASAVMATTSLRYFGTGIAEITGSETWMTIAGLLGLALAVVSFYAAFALAAVAERGWTMPLARKD
jgi:succinate-acetate transporter protein